MKLHEEKDELFSIFVFRTKDKKFLVLGSRSTDTWDRWLLSTADARGRASGSCCRARRATSTTSSTGTARSSSAPTRTPRTSASSTAPLDDPQPARWKPFVDHRADVLLQDFEVFKDFVVVQEKQAALNHLRVHAFATGAWKEVAFPEPVYAAFAAGTPEFDSKRFRYSYQSLVTPSSVYDYDMQTGESQLLKREEVLGGFDPQRYVSQRLWATARDGVKVPISIVYPKGHVARRPRAAVALRLRLLRLRHARDASTASG